MLRSSAPSRQNFLALSLQCSSSAAAVQQQCSSSAAAVQIKKEGSCLSLSFTSIALYFRTSFISNDVTGSLNSKTILTKVDEVLLKLRGISLITSECLIPNPSAVHKQAQPITLSQSLSASAGSRIPNCYSRSARSGRGLKKVKHTFILELGKL